MIGRRAYAVRALSERRITSKGHQRALMGDSGKTRVKAPDLSNAIHSALCPIHHFKG